MAAVSYHSVKREFIKIIDRCANKCEIVDRLKAEFADRVSSRRQLEYIESISDLIYVLERRLVTKDDARFFHRLILPIEFDGKSELLNMFGIRSADEQAIDGKTRRIIEILAKHIGIHWKDFSRELGLTEHNIVTLENRYNNDVNVELIAEILRIYESILINKSLYHLRIKSAVDRVRPDLNEKMDEIYLT